jgi:hypothetical protein
MIHVSPDHLWSVFEGRTHVQAHKLIELYIGNWMTLSGPLGNVGDILVTFQYGLLPSMKGIYMQFNDEPSRDRLSMLLPGHYITVIGQLAEVRSMDIELDNCILLDPM